MTMALLPLGCLALAAVAAMLLAPLGRPAAPRPAAATGLALAVLIVLWRLGDAPAPLPPLLADDGLARFGTLIACLSGLAVLGFGAARREAPALVVITALGASALAGAVHVASLVLGLEIVSLALIGLFVLPLTATSLEAGYKYLLPGAAGSAALLMGAALAYADTGRLDFTAWAGGGNMAAVATALLLAGLGFKLSLVPFHVWAPDIYDGAPPAAAALAGSAAKVAVVIAILRLDAAQPATPLWHQGLALMAMASILLGNLAALRQPSLVRVIGYSSVAHSGYIAAMIACGVGAAAAPLLFYMAAYVPALIAALAVAGSLGSSNAAALRGLVWRWPLAGAALALALASLAGLPVAAGFLAKLFLVGTIVGAGAWGLLAAVVIGSGLGLFVYFRFFTALFARDGEGTATVTLLPNRAVMAACLALLLVFGFYPGPLFGWLALAAR